MSYFIVQHNTQETAATKRQRRTTMGNGIITNFQDKAQDTSSESSQSSVPQSSSDTEEERKDFLDLGQEFISRRDRRHQVAFINPSEEDAFSGQIDMAGSEPKKRIGTSYKDLQKSFLETGNKNNNDQALDEDDDFESIMDAQMGNTAATLNLYKRRSTAAKYNPKILNENKQAARSSVKFDVATFQEDLQSHLQEQKSKLAKTLIVPSTQQDEMQEVTEEAKSSTQQDEFSDLEHDDIGDESIEYYQDPLKSKSVVEPNVLGKLLDDEVDDDGYTDRDPGIGDEDNLSSEHSFINEHFTLLRSENQARESLRKSPRKSLYQVRDNDDKDILGLINKNERRHQAIASEQLKMNSVISLKNYQSDNIVAKILSDFKILNSVTTQLIAERQFHNYRATCIGLTDILLLIGNSEGQLQMFDRQTEEFYQTFQEKGKVFSGNAITALDVHPIRTDYVVIGYEKGQLILVDTTTEPIKSLKVIKDHHKGVPIANVKFCEWSGKNAENVSEQTQQLEDKQVWMFVSIDADGKVIVNTISKVMFIYKASKHIVVDPSKINIPIFSSLTPRFYSQMHPQGEENDSVTLIAMGNAESVFIISVRPGKHQELLKIDRPKKYFSKKQMKQEDFKPRIPSLAWGYGHSPILKDRCYSLLAIAWGPLIQLIVLNNIESDMEAFFKDGYYLLRPSESQRAQSKNTRASPAGEHEEHSDDDDDEGISFTTPGLNIENIQFLSESTLLVLTQDLEIRILYTQSFFPKGYASVSQDKNFIEKEKLRQDAELDKPKPELEQGIYLKELSKSEHGVLYHQTIKIYDGMVVGLTPKSIIQAYHLSWVHYIMEFKRQVKGDWIKVFARALDIYQGKVKGFKEVSEDKEIRENTMKAELKLLIRDIICEVIEKWSQFEDKLTKNQDADDDATDILNSLTTDQDKHSKYKTLIRIAIEFCVEIQDCYFLFYDLFLLFQEEKMVDQFIKEMQPFIMAGRFQEWELPTDILQNHIINYYKDPRKPENLERIIINLNFVQCPKPVVLELIHFAEQHYLSTAILFLYTQVFERKDNSSCVQVLFSLFNLYMKAGKERPGSIEQVKTLKNLPEFSQTRVEIEKTSVYIGYKILWIIQLFLRGKKFPQGNIREKKWRTYVHDIIEFISTKNILDALLSIDAECLFQIISILFYEGKAFEFVKQGRDPEQGTHLVSMNHKDLLKKLDDFCQGADVSEEIKLQYLFFVANVAAKSQIEQEQSFYYNIVKQLLSQHKKFLSFNNLLLQRAMSSKKLHRRMSRELQRKIPDEVKHVLKSENDLNQLLHMCEPLSNEQIAELLKLAEETQFSQVQVYLLEKKEDYIKCLQLFLSGMKLSETWTPQESQEKVFKWIREKLSLLEHNGQPNGLEQFKKEIRQSIKSMVTMSAKETVRLIEDKFQEAHKELIDVLTRDAYEQFLYLDALLELKDQEIQDTIKDYSLKSTNALEAKKYLEYLKQHLRLCCSLKKTRVLEIVEKIVNHAYYPIEDCLKICQEYNMLEACALLNKKLGKYFESVQQYITIMKDKIDLNKLKKELYFWKQKGESAAFCINSPKEMPECTKFDTYFKRVMKICKKNYREVDIGKEEAIWYLVLDTLLDLKQRLVVVRKSYCYDFFINRITLFIQLLIANIPFSSFMDHVMSVQKSVKFRDLKEVILGLFGDMRSEQIVLNNANNAIFKVNTDQFKLFEDVSSNGILFRSLKCLLCKKYFDNFYGDDTPIQANPNQPDEDADDMFYDPYSEEIRIYHCRHPFHISCLNKFFLVKFGDSDEVRKKKEEKQRCPECFKRNYDIENDNGSPIRPRTRAPQKQNSTIGEKSSENGSALMRHEASSDRGGQAREKGQLNRSQSVINRQLLKLKKRMETFDTVVEHEGLTSKNFKT